ncbi:MAG: YdbH domain-containing protein, partial [Desulfobacterales bacterium]
GRIEAEGRGSYRAGHMNAGLQLNLTGGRLLLPEQKGGLVGLQGAIAFPDLLAMRTAPRQSFFFERAYIGDIAATDGQIDLQIEPGGVLFLEQIQFKWCQGIVYLPATRIVPGNDDYELTLWCDRLKLAHLLEQLGAAQVEGGGTVSGRIPVRFRRGQVLVDSGFLYSSPGEGGTIKLRGTEMLTAGIPPGTPEYTQLELARQALKEYDYHWVKLSLATAPEEDLLRLKLQLDGKPSRPLPFIYDPSAGGFVPAGPDSKGSTFQGISLDVNFSLPLNRLMEYKDLMKLFP